MALLINEDYETFYAHHPPEAMNEQGLREQADRYFRGGASLVFFNVNAQRAYFDSRVYEPIWQGMEKGPDGIYRHRGEEVPNQPLPTLVNAVHAKMLQDNTDNPVQIRIDQSRRNGGLGGLSVRMNDCHLGDLPNSPMHSDIWFDHPEWRLRATTGLDFAVPEVRAKVLALCGELFSRFDFDALELDWMRTPPFFKAGKEDENRHLLDELVRQVFELKRQAEKRTGHTIRLAVRVPSRPDEALRLGLDVTGWARKGWLDMVIACAFICSTDNTMPLEIWQQLLPETVEVIPGIDILTAPYKDAPGIETQISEIIWGYAAAFYYRGAKSIYLFNHFPSLQQQESYQEKIHTVSDRERTEKASRRHVAAMCCNQVPGIAPASSLPLKALTDWQSVRIEIGGALKDRRITLLFAFEAAPDVNLERFDFTVNEIPCPVSSEPYPYALPEPAWRKVVCKVPVNVLNGGSAVLSFRAPNTCRAVLHWCELDVAAAANKKVPLKIQTDGFA